MKVGVMPCFVPSDLTTYLGSQHLLRYLMCPAYLKRPALSAISFASPNCNAYTISPCVQEG